MLSGARFATILPSTDLARSRAFYEGQLGLTVAKADDYGVALNAGEGTLFIYTRETVTPAEHTVAGWEVPDIRAAVQELTSRGVVFEQYDFPGLKTDELGIAIMDGGAELSAWVKDPDGHILAINQGWAV
jgi:catechol 2,3-dioxygenase-like lactoylglutathione lyase family enzyme